MIAIIVNNYPTIMCYTNLSKAIAKVSNEKWKSKLVKEKKKKLIEL